MAQYEVGWRDRAARRLTSMALAVATPQFRSWVKLGMWDALDRAATDDDFWLREVSGDRVTVDHLVWAGKEKQWVRPENLPWPSGTRYIVKRAS